MRLIEQLRWWAAECDRTNFGCQARKLLLEAAESLEKAEPVKHGRWIDRYGGKYVNPLYECSECKETALYEAEVNELGNEYFAQVLSSVCPNCGAKMDGERVALEEVVDIDAQTQRNNAAMRRVIDFVMDGGAETQ